MPKTLVLEGVNFDNDSAKLRYEADEVLDKAAATTLARLAGKRKARRGNPPELSA